MSSQGGARQTYSLTLRRGDSSNPWGFRMQGGADFAVPLSVQLVQPSSIAELSGVMVGDQVVQINANMADTMSHEEAKQAIVVAGNSVDLVVQRGAVLTWKPKVTPLSELRPEELQTHTLPGESAPVQRTSLVANRPIQVTSKVGSAHNRSARPFPGFGGVSYPQTVGSAPVTAPPAAPVGSAPVTPVAAAVSVPVAPPTSGQMQATPPPASQQQTDEQTVQHSQYNTPIGLYSGKNLANAYVDQSDAIRTNMSSLDIGSEEQSSTSLSSPGSYHHRQTGSSLSSGSISPPPGSLENNNVFKASGFVPSPVRSPPYHSRNGSGKGSFDGSGTGSFDASCEDPKPLHTYLQENPPAVGSAVPTSPGLHKPRKSAVMEAIENEINPQPLKGSTVQSRSFRMLQQGIDSGSLPPPSGIKGFSSVKAPTAQPGDGQPPPPPSEKCFMCGGFITGVFVTVKKRPLHADCLRCNHCRRNLKTIGYFWVNDSLYCEQHARDLTRPPGGGYTAYVVDAAPDQ